MANIVVRQAERLLSALQKGGRPSAGTIGGARVTVEPLPENAFRISGIPKNGDDAAFRTLADAGALMELDQDAKAYHAVVTWDTMVHRLVSEGALDLVGKGARNGAGKE